MSQTNGFLPKKRTYKSHPPNGAEPQKVEPPEPPEPAETSCWVCFGVAGGAHGERPRRAGESARGEPALAGDELLLADPPATRMGRIRRVWEGWGGVGGGLGPCRGENKLQAPSGRDQGKGKGKCHGHLGSVLHWLCADPGCKIYSKSPWHGGVGGWGGGMKFHAQGLGGTGNVGENVHGKPLIGKGRELVGGVLKPFEESWIYPVIFLFGWFYVSLQESIYVKWEKSTGPQS